MSDNEWKYVPVRRFAEDTFRFTANPVLGDGSVRVEQGHDLPALSPRPSWFDPQPDPPMPEADGIIAILIGL